MRISLGFQAACVAALALSLVTCGGWSHERDHETRVTGVQLSKTSLSLPAGSQESLTATVQPTNATNRKVTWQSSNPAVASVDGSGMVKAHTPGQTTVTVITQDCGNSSHSSDHHSDGHGSHGGGHHSDGHTDNCNGGHTHHATVDVYGSETRATGVQLNKTSLSLPAGSQESLTATVQPTNAANTKVTWQSSNPAVASVDGSGTVKAHKLGRATVTVTTQDCGDSSHSSDHHSDGHGSHGGGHHSDGHADSCNGGHTHDATVDVYDPPVPAIGVDLDATELSLEIGASQTLTATVLPPSATVITVSWNSSDETVAIVSNGVVTATGAGVATITVTTDDGGHVATCIVTVTQ